MECCGDQSGGGGEIGVGEEDKLWQKITSKGRVWGNFVPSVKLLIGKMNSEKQIRQRMYKNRVNSRLSNVLIHGKVMR